MRLQCESTFVTSVLFSSVNREGISRTKETAYRQRQERKEGSTQDKRQNDKGQDGTVRYFEHGGLAGRWRRPTGRVPVSVHTGEEEGEYQGGGEGVLSVVNVMVRYHECQDSTFIMGLGCYYFHIFPWARKRFKEVEEEDLIHFLRPNYFVFYKNDSITSLGKLKLIISIIASRHKLKKAFIFCWAFRKYRLTHGPSTPALFYVNLLDIFLNTLASHKLCQIIPFWGSVINEGFLLSSETKSSTRPWQ